MLENNNARYVAFFGDVHGSTAISMNWLLHDLLEVKKLKIGFVIQVGDFGIYDQFKFWQHEAKWNKINPWGVPVYFIGGNHENWKMIGNWTLKHPDTPFIPIQERLFYCQHGASMVLHGRKFMFIGGAENRVGEPNHIYILKDQSIITNYLSVKEVQHIVDDYKDDEIDVLVTHTIQQATAGFPQWGDASLNPVRELNARAHVVGHVHKMKRWDENGTDTIVCPETVTGHCWLMDLDTGKFHQVDCTENWHKYVQFKKEPF